MKICFFLTRLLNNGWDHLSWNFGTSFGSSRMAYNSIRLKMATNLNFLNFPKMIHFRCFFLDRWARIWSSTTMLGALIYRIQAHYIVIGPPCGCGVLLVVLSSLLGISLMRVQICKKTSLFKSNRSSRFLMAENKTYRTNSNFCLIFLL